MESFRKVSGRDVIFNRKFYGILNLISSLEDYITKDFRIIVEQNAVNYEITKYEMWADDQLVPLRKEVIESVCEDSDSFFLVILLFKSICDSTCIASKTFDTPRPTAEAAPAA